MHDSVREGGGEDWRKYRQLMARAQEVNRLVRSPVFTAKAAGEGDRPAVLDSARDRRDCANS